MITAGRSFLIHNFLEPIRQAMSDDESNNTSRSTFAEQLSDLDVDVTDESNTSTSDAETSAPDDARPGDGPGQATNEDEADSMSDEDLFRQAVDNLDPARIYDAKFKGDPGASLPEDSTPKPSSSSPATSSSDDKSDAERRRDVQRVRDEALFKQMVGPVNPIDDRDKYHRPSTPPKRPSGDDGDGPDQTLVTPSLPRSGDGLHFVPPLTAPQRALLKRHRRFSKKHSVPDLHLRGDTRDEALSQLGEFVPRHWRGEARFVRIIHGRGLRSELEPVIKPAVLEWLESAGLQYIRGYVPERVQSGDYGSLIVELSPRDSQ